MGLRSVFEAGPRAEGPPAGGFVGAFGGDNSVALGIELGVSDRRIGLPLDPLVFLPVPDGRFSFVAALQNARDPHDEFTAGRKGCPVDRKVGSQVAGFLRAGLAVPDTDAAPISISKLFDNQEALIVLRIEPDLLRVTIRE